MILGAAETGKTIDLAGNRYRSDVDDSAIPPKNRFLAGLVRELHASRILEVGTFHGGAIMAMTHGLLPSITQPEILTIDVESHNEEGFANYPQINRVIRDSLSPLTIDDVRQTFSDHIDLLFIDSGHDYRQAFENIAVYGNLLKPRIIVLDDIALNRSMSRMWERVKYLAPGAVEDISAIAGRTNVGFGLIGPQYPFEWPEMGAARRAAWRGYWAAGRAIVPRLPTSSAQRVRQLLRGQ